MKQYDALVIGGGPAGLAASLYLARFGLNFALVEKVSPGGLLLLTDEIENYPGLPKVKGYALADAMAAQLGDYVFDRYTDAVTAFEHTPGKNRVRVGEEWLEARAVIVCSGVQYRKLGLPEENRYLGKGLSHCALCDGNFFRGQVIGVVGGGNSALEEAMYLAKLVKEVHLIHRRGAFRADRIVQEKFGKVPNVVQHLHSVVSGLHGLDGLEGITLTRTDTGEKSKLAVSGLFIFTGFVPNTDFAPEVLTRDEGGFIVTDTEMRTNLPGVFAAGDARAKSCRQIVTAVGDGATSANAVFAYLESTHA